MATGWFGVVGEIAVVRVLAKNEEEAKTLVAKWLQKPGRENLLWQWKLSGQQVQPA